VRKTNDCELDLAFSRRLRPSAAAPKESAVPPTTEFRERLQNRPGVSALKIEHAFDVVEEWPLVVLAQKRLRDQINEALLISVKRGKKIAHGSDTARARGSTGVGDIMRPGNGPVMHEERPLPGPKSHRPRSRLWPATTAPQSVPVKLFAQLERAAASEDDHSWKPKTPRELVDGGATLCTDSLTRFIR